MPTQISGTTGISRNALPFLVGQVCFFGMVTAPSGFLACDGSAISRSTYSALFTAIGTLYGVGDGSTTFNLPDLRGEFLRGWDQGRGVDSGRVIGSAQADDFKTHTHSTEAGLAQNIGTTPRWFNSSIASSGAGSVTSSATGGAETRPRNIALLACIFAGV